MGEEADRQKLVDDHFLFVSGDKNLISAGMERDWPEGRGIYHNEAKTFLTWVNEEDQLRIISMQKGGDVRGVFDRLARRNLDMTLCWTRDMVTSMPARQTLAQE